MKQHVKIQKKLTEYLWLKLLDEIMIIDIDQPLIASFIPQFPLAWRIRNTENVKHVSIKEQNKLLN